MYKIIHLLAMLNQLSSYQGAEHVNRKEIMCLATAIYHESRGEPLMGQFAVGHTILNRVRSDGWAPDVCGVVYAPQQFSHINSAKPDYLSKAWETAVEVALFSYVGFVEDPTEGALWFYAQDKVTPSWANEKGSAKVIGGHTFLRSRNINVN